MIILVDTNVLIDFLRGYDSFIDIFKTERIIISGVVYSELLYGSKSEKEIYTIRELYRKFGTPETDLVDWEKTGLLIKKLKKKRNHRQFSGCRTRRAMY